MPSLRSAFGSSARNADQYACPGVVAADASVRSGCSHVLDTRTICDFGSPGVTTETLFTVAFLSDVPEFPSTLPPVVLVANSLSGLVAGTTAIGAPRAGDNVARGGVGTDGRPPPLAAEEAVGSTDCVRGSPGVPTEGILSLPVDVVAPDRVGAEGSTDCVLGSPATPADGMFSLAFGAGAPCDAEPEGSTDCVFGSPATPTFGIMSCPGRAVCGVIDCGSCCCLLSVGTRGCALAAACGGVPSMLRWRFSHVPVCFAYSIMLGLAACSRPRCS